MPIKDPSAYPPNWKSEIRPRILARADNRCEQCGVQNHIEIVRSDIDAAYYIVYEPNEGGYRYMDGSQMRLSEIPEEYGHLKHVRIVLTIAHWPDPTPSNCRDDNLLALCQRCHNTLDAPMRSKHAQVTRRNKRDATTGQSRMFD